MKNTHWHILGAGSIGTLFGFYLQKAGVHIELIKRDAFAGNLPHSTCVNIHLQGSKSINSTIDSEESICFKHFRPSEASIKSINHLLIATKAHQTDQALAPIIPYLTDSPTVLVLQNGMGGVDLVSKLVPAARILVGSTTEGANRPQPERLVHAGIGTTWIGSLEPMHQHLAQELVSDWQKLSLDINFDPHINQRLWQKLAINCAINPLTVLFNCNNGALLENPEALALMQQICDEVTEVIARQPDLTADSGLFDTAKQVAEKTSANISSMLQDARAGRETEIDFINGFIEHKAGVLGLPCHTNAQLVKSIKQIHLAQKKA